MLTTAFHACQFGASSLARQQQVPRKHMIVANAMTRSSWSHQLLEAGSRRICVSYDGTFTPDIDA